MDNTILKFASKYPDNEFNSGDWEVGALETMVSKDTDDMYYIGKRPTNYVLFT